MAQKTPVPALTIDRSGTWTSLWYYDSDFQKMWSSSMNLQYAIGAYFATKRRLLQRMAVLQNNHLTLVNLQVLSLTKAGREPLLFKNTSIRQKLKKATYGMTGAVMLTTNKKNQLLTAPLNKTRGQRRLRFRQRLNYLLNYLPVSLTAGLYWSRRSLFQRVVRWGLLQPSGSNFNAVSYKAGTQSTLTYLKAYNVQQMKLKSQRGRKAKIKSRRGFSHSAVNLNYQFNVSGDLLSMRQRSIKISHVGSYYNQLVTDAKLNQVTPVLTRAVYRRWLLDKHQYHIFRPKLLRKKLKNWWPKLLKLHFSYRNRNRLKKMRYARKFMKLSMLKAACQHITSFETRLNVRRYIFYSAAATDAIGRVAFARWQRRRYCYPTIMVVYQSIMRGSALLLVNYLKNYLRGAKMHSSMLFLVSTALKFYLQHREEVDRITDLTTCAGVRLVADGKLDGSDRSKVFKTQVGAIPTSTFAGPTDVEFAVCGTRYGILGLYVWYFMKPAFFTSRFVSYYGRTAFRKVQVRNRRPKAVKEVPVLY